MPGNPRAPLFARALVVTLAVAASLAAKPTPAPKSNPDTIAPMVAVADTSLALGGKVVYVDFWASWCVPCRHSFPWMRSVLDRFQARGLRIVTVNLDRKPGDARKFMRELNVTLPVVFDSTGTFAKLYQLQAMPTSFLYGRDGKLRERVEGFHDDHALALEGVIEGLLAEKGTK